MTVTLTPEKCDYPLIHDGHEWETHEPATDEPDEDGWVPVTRWCEGNADQDDPMDRYECCDHCRGRECPRRDGHKIPCEHEGCRGTVMTGEVEPS